MTSDTSEKGLETLIVTALTGRESPTTAQSGAVHYTAPGYGRVVTPKVMLATMIVITR